MILPANIMGILLALASSFVWGSGDFSGGVATRKLNQFQVLALSSLSGVVILIAAALIWQESLPTYKSVIWAMLAGLAGAVGVSSLYRGLSKGHSAAVAPTAAVIGAALPVGFAMLTVGIPQVSRLVGFGLAFIGIWLVSSISGMRGRDARSNFLIGAVAGVGFAGYFIFISQVEVGKVFIPLIIARGIMFISGLFLLKTNHLPFPKMRSNPIALLAGVLDAGGNILFLLARQLSLLDIAVVLSSLYPAITVMWSRLILKEKITGRQWAGLVVCLIAIVLITM